jgi:hypothetical protein
MRMIDIALFLLIFNVLLSFVMAEGLFENEKFAAADPMIDSGYADSLNQSNITSGTAGFDPFGFTTATSFFTTTLNAVGFVVTTIYGATTALPAVISQVMGGSAEANSLGSMIAIAIWGVYLIGLMQFVRGVGTKGMD